ncbi:trimeric intracellular cation channel family protein [Atopobium fossor]|uniref:trimeric intracellular cation channel family protein n=1 Tax=Atopobium fossor TaxID=39487 RepID=UPI00041C1BF9|nr:TRIC cation channel family protein [Atopobium fossor]
MLHIPIWLDLAAVIVGALAGVWSAQERKLDLVGYIGLSFLCGLGGGLIRDMAMQVGSVYMLQSPYAIPFVVATGVIGYFFPQIIKRFPNLLDWLDILSVGLFVVAGTDKAIHYNLYPMACMLMGVVTGVGGGMMRDVFLGDTPRIFQRSNFYAVAAIGGAIVYYSLTHVSHYNLEISAAASIFVTLGLRRLSLRYNVTLPTEMDLTPKVAAGAKKIKEKTRRNK